MNKFWRPFFNLEDIFWMSIKHFYLDSLKALWRRFEGSISKSLKHTVLTFTGRITWSPNEDILKTGVSSIYKTIYGRVKKFQHE